MLLRQKLLYVQCFVFFLFFFSEERQHDLTKAKILLGLKKKKKTIFISEAVMFCERSLHSAELWVLHGLFFFLSFSLVLKEQCFPCDSP